MDRQEKLNAIVERLKEKGTVIKAEMVSAMVIVGYLNDLANLGLIANAFNITESGATIRAVCDEFDWKPSDEEIKQFVMEMVEPNEQAPFMFLVQKWRDDRETVIDDMNKFKETGEKSV